MGALDSLESLPIGASTKIFTTARHARNQKHATEETEEAEGLGVCVAGDNSSQAAKVLVDSCTEDAETAGSAEKSKSRVASSEANFFVCSAIHQNLLGPGRLGLRNRSTLHLFFSAHPAVSASSAVKILFGHPIGFDLREMTNVT